MKRVLLSFACAVAIGAGAIIGASLGVWTVARCSGVIVPYSAPGPVDWLPEGLR
jgi:uncharacterized membrane protein YfcA